MDSTWSSHAVELRSTTPGQIVTKVALAVVISLGLIPLISNSIQTLQ